MRGKIAGLTLAVLGLVILALGLTPVYDQYTKNILFISFLSSNNIIIIGAGILIIGLVLVRTGRSGRQASEVPIYHGKNVVGFRRMGK